MKVNDPSGDNSDQYEFGNLLKAKDEKKAYLLYGMIGFGILALLFACSVILGFRSLKLAIDVIDASADFMMTTKRIIAVPILYFFMTLLVVFVWIGMLFCVVSMNKIEPSKSIPQGKSITVTSEFNYYANWYMIFGLLWLVSFVQYKSQFIVQVSASTYYFNSS
jgi:hypothetical protein